MSPHLGVTSFIIMNVTSSSFRANIQGLFDQGEAWNHASNFSTVDGLAHLDDGHHQHSFNNQRGIYSTFAIHFERPGNSSIVLLSDVKVSCGVLHWVFLYCIYCFIRMALWTSVFKTGTFKCLCHSNVTDVTVSLYTTTFLVPIQPNTSSFQSNQMYLFVCKQFKAF